MIHNPNCDGDKCRANTGEVRVMSIGGGGNLILCRACWENELSFRRERNRVVCYPFDLPAWEFSKVYAPAESEVV